MPAVGERSVGRLRFIEAQPPASTRHRGALVLLHAFPLNAWMWERQLALAERGWRVVAPHFRGFTGGRVSVPDEETHSAARASVPGEETRPQADAETRPHIDDYAGDVVDLLDALHIHEAVVGGLSMGGYVAFALLRQASRYVQGLILADTKATPDTAEGVEGRKRMIQLARDKGPAAVAEEMIPKLLGDSTRRTRPDLVEVVRRLATSSSADAIAAAVSALMTRPDSSPQLASIHIPTLIVVGEEDTVTPRTAAEEMHRGIAGSELVAIPAAGHLTNLEQPAAFDDALARFLDHRV